MEEPRYPPDFELKAPAAPDSVSAICGVNSVRVVAKKDLLGIGKPVHAADVTLGGCPATGEDAETQVLVFESELHGCGSQLLVRVYSNHFIDSSRSIKGHLDPSTIFETRR